MSYSTTDFYRDTYQGRACTSDDTLEKWLSRASDDIDIYTFNSFDTADLSVAALAALQKACCAQAESYLVIGDGFDDFENFSIGSFSIKKGASGQDRSGVLCENAQRYLFQAGLLFRGVNVCSRSHV
jgi:hypothetical protein